MLISNQNLITKTNFTGLKFSKTPVKSNMKFENRVSNYSLDLTHTQSIALKNQRISFTSNSSCSHTQNESKKRTFFSEKGEEVIFENGIAKLKSTRKPFNGYLDIENKKDNYRIYYRNGNVFRSDKNQVVYKRFYDIDPESTVYYDLMQYFFGDKKFSDDSKMAGFDFYDNHRPSVKLVEKPLSLHHNLWDILTYIIANNEAKYDGEADFGVIKFVGATGRNEKSRFIRYKSDTQEKPFEFTSTSEANEYFIDEYGIDAEFNNITQAQIAKAAVDEFVELFQDKKCLEGLRFETGEFEDNIIANFHLDSCQISYKNNSLLEDFNKAYISGNGIKYVKSHEPDYIKFTGPKIRFNKNITWNKSHYDIGRYHPNYEAKSFIIHEIGHYLHSKNNPYKYLIADSKKIRFVNEISFYATEDAREFVAEYILGRMSGKTYSQEMDRAYLDCGGPNIFQGSNSLS